MSYTELKCCRICGGTELIPTLELGIQAMAGTFPANVVEDAALTRGPLKLVRCAEASCGLVQLSCTYDLVEQYGDGYGYRSGLNKGMVKHLGEIAKHLDNDRRKFVLDIGSNDGTLLSKYSRDLNCYGKPGEFVGFDPTSKKFAKFYPPDVEKHAEFFTATAFRAAYGGACKADIVTAISMFYDLPDPQQFVHDVASILSDDGVFYFEQSYVGSVVERLAYDTVCHEHLEYYGIKQVALLLLTYALALLMVSTVRYPSFKHLKLHGRQPMSSFVIAVALLSFALAAYPLFIFTGISLYVASGPVLALRAWRRGERAFGDAGADAAGSEPESSRESG